MDQIQPAEKKQSLQAAERLEKAKDEILTRWESIVRRELSEAKRESKPKLRDSLPQFLDHISKALRQCELSGSVRTSLIHIAIEHAEDRAFHSDYTVEHVIREYELLRKVIFDTLERDQVLQPAARETILDAVTAGMTKASGEFAELAAKREEQIQTQLEDSEDLFRAVFQLAASGKAVIDAQSGRFLQVNRKLCEILGYTEVELKQKTLSEITHEGDSHNRKIAFKPIEANGSWPQEKLYIRKDKSLVWVLISRAPLPSKNGQTERLISTIFDITAQKEIEEKFQSLHTITEAALTKVTNFHTLLEVMLDQVKDSFKSDTVAILLLDENKQFLQVSAARGLENEIDKKMKVPIGKGISGRAFATGESQKIDDISKAEPYSPILKSTNVRCLISSPMNASTEKIGVITVGRITARPFSDDDLLLLQLVADRIATAIESSRLYELSQKQVKELRVERSLREQFVNTLTHDLRTPLSAIKIAAQILQSIKSDHASIDSLIDRILGNVIRSDRLIQDLLDTSRIRAGQGVTVHVKFIAMPKIVREVIGDLRDIYGDRFCLQTPDSLDGYWCPLSIRRIVENLCSNAVKYGDKDGPIQVRLENLTNQIRLSVNNKGNPLREEDVATLFCQYKRAKTAEDSEVLGWGIGLTIVKGLTEAHCGEITVKSNANEGTTFFITLPRDSRPCRENQ